MRKQRESNKKGQLINVGLFFLIIGILVVLYAPLKKLKDEVFADMRLAIYHEEINEDNTTIQNLPTENIISGDPNNQTEGSEQKISYTYIGQLTIPSINFKRGFVSKNSKYNNINYNVTIAKESSYPDVKNGNFILMAHSGDAPISFFDNLYKLKIGDQASVSYEAKAYYYELVKTYEVDKTGKIAIFRDYNKKTLTLITCTHDSDTKQSVYIFEQTKE